MPRKFEDKVDRPFLHSFMTKHRYGVVSSQAADGTPQSALVGIATSPDLEIIFDTVRSSRKYPNLIARPRWIRYSDFDQRPPLIEEMVFDQK